MRKWTVAILAVVLAVSTLTGVAAQQEPSPPETANVDVTVWRLVADPSFLYVSTRPEGGRWRTLQTALDMSALSDTGNYHQSNAVRVEVPLPGLAPYTCPAASGHTPLHGAIADDDVQLVRRIAGSCPQFLDRVSGAFFYD